VAIESDMNGPSIVYWLILLLLILVLHGDKLELGRYFRHGGPRGPSHPLPVTSPIETSRGAANPKD
jgi:hypothetical protein